MTSVSLTATRAMIGRVVGSSKLVVIGLAANVTSGGTPVLTLAVNGVPQSPVASTPLTNGSFVTTFAAFEVDDNSLLTSGFSTLSLNSDRTARMGASVFVAQCAEAEAFGFPLASGSTSNPVTLSPAPTSDDHAVIAAAITLETANFRNYTTAWRRNFLGAVGGAQDVSITRASPGFSWSGVDALQNGQIAVSTNINATQMFLMRYKSRQ